MKFKAIVLGLNDDIEEEVLLQIGEWKILCFAGVCPYPIYVGHDYVVNLSLVVLNDYVVSECTSGPQPVIENNGKGFVTHLIGKLLGSRLIIGDIGFEDEIFLRDYGYLNGKFVSIQVDRISAEFL